MLKQLTLLMVVAALSVSCKKGRTDAEDELFVGCWQPVIQLQTGDRWPGVNTDSIRATGKFSYEFKRNRTAIFKRVVIAANTPMSPDFILKWKPGMPLGNVYTTPLPATPPALPTETIMGYWDYNKEKKQLRIIGNQRQMLETWQLEVMEEHQLITPSLVVNLSGNIPGIPRKQKVRFIFIKK
jgi:hypothetical protein